MSSESISISGNEKSTAASITGRELVGTNEKSVVDTSTVERENLSQEELDYLATKQAAHKWYQWFSSSDSQAERKLIIKLDLLILLYVFLSSFVKTLDSTTVPYAYVSGMKEALGMYGNQLTYQSSVYMAGFIFGQIPLSMLATKVPIHIYLPVMDTIWSFFTLGMFKITNYHQLYALRFCIGFMGSFFFPTVQWILGSWYTSSELTKRSAIYFCASQVGAMSGGYIQAAAQQNLNGVGGLAGWQWLYVIAFIITTPITAYGVLVLPGLPDKPRKWNWFLSEDELKLARLRMLREGRESSYTTITYSSIKKAIFGNWHFGMLVLYAVFFSQADGISSYSGLTLWLQENYSNYQTNTITTVIPAVTMVFSLINGALSDSFKDSYHWLIAYVAVLNLLAGILLTIWNISSGGKMFAFFLSGTADSIAAVLYSWANIICSADNVERALTLSTMNTLGNTFSVWVPLFVWQTDDAPRYLKGYAYNVGLDAVMLILLVPLVYLYKRDQRLARQ
jgi:MFS transporter, ACS family, pantothenate transporter